MDRVSSEAMEWLHNATVKCMVLASTGVTFQIWETGDGRELADWFLLRFSLCILSRGAVFLCSLYSLHNNHLQFFIAERIRGLKQLYCNKDSNSQGRILSKRGAKISGATCLSSHCWVARDVLYLQGWSHPRRLCRTPPTRKLKTTCWEGLSQKLCHAGIF